MIKLILAVIAMIFVGLAAYVYMNPKETDASVAKVAQKTERSIVKKEAPSVQKETVSATVEVFSEKKVDIKPVEKVGQVTKTQYSDSTEIENDIGRGLTLESIQSMDVSAEEKERLILDLVAYEGNHMEQEEPMSEEEALRLISEDVKNGILP